ncbi:glycoside hydrolase family 16 protein [Pseudonocardia sp. ICBG1142]|uniref:glycoside hydrolase family 16 protein n=1 Tax=Pseudonocardia sp. ICBG1142 TaxID=2846760 RepID=UPI001CF64A80|nr:glycoside hydrolase family 16 protein [Pseudonocardia sp. ICBG1142]
MIGSGLVTAVVGAVTSLAVAFAPAAPVPAAARVECGWRITAVHVLAELDGDTSERAQMWRSALTSVGADQPGFIPATCYQAGNHPDDHENGSTEHPAQTGQTGQDAPGPGGSSALPSVPGQGDTAGEVFGWGAPDVVDDFTGTQLGPGWNAYDGPGHAGNGTRSPAAATVADGILTIDGTGDGTTAGLAWTAHSQKYGRWEVRMRAPTGSPSYNALALLWPTEENFPVGGEIDFAEIMDPSRDKIELFLHYGADNSQVHGELKIDATEWHNYAVEWTPGGVTAFVDGREWWKTTDTSILPPGPMHLCLQLDWFPRGDGEPGRMQVDWVKQWGLAAGEGPSTTSGGSAGSTDADSSTSITDEINNNTGRSS